jgi:hypothetical protein
MEKVCGYKDAKGEFHDHMVDALISNVANTIMAKVNKIGCWQTWINKEECVAAVKELVKDEKGREELNQLLKTF